MTLPAHLVAMAIAERGEASRLAPYLDAERCRDGNFRGLRFYIRNGPATGLVAFAWWLSRL